MQKGRGASVADYTVENHGRVRDVAGEILRWLGWPQPAGE
jgi:hypothetical protein